MIDDSFAVMSKNTQNTTLHLFGYYYYYCLVITTKLPSQIS